MNCDEIKDLIYDIRDGKTKHKALNCLLADERQKHDVSEGDLVEMNNDYFVVVGASNDGDWVFVSTIESFIHNNRSYSSYSHSDSGWEHISKMKRIGHIIMEEEYK